MSEIAPPPKTHYEILRIASDATGDEVRAAYRRMSRRFHPDRHPRHPDAAARIMASVNVAYDVLSDPRRRADYDTELRNPRSREAIRMRPVRPAAAVPSVSPWQPGVDPVPFFGVQREGAPAAMARRRTVAVRRLLAGSAAGCALALGLWIALAPAGGEPEVDVARIVDARNQRAAGRASAAATEVAGNDGLRRSRPLDRSHVRPLETPNGTPWPPQSGELDGFVRWFNDGQARLTLDNRLGPSDVFAKLYRRTEDGLIPARHVFVRAHDQFPVSELRPGNYEVRYFALDTGQTLRSVQLTLEAPGDGADAPSFRIDDMQGRSGRAVPISREEFMAPALRLKLSQEPSAPASMLR